MSGYDDGKKQALSQETLRRIMEEFPVFDWSDEETEELVAPRHGVISGFSEMMEDVRALSEKDLGDTAPACEPKGSDGR
jgi:hypothetical protein